MRGSQVTSGQESGEEGLGIPGLLVTLCNPGALAHMPRVLESSLHSCQLEWSKCTWDERGLQKYLVELPNSHL